MRRIGSIQFVTPELTFRRGWQGKGHRVTRIEHHQYGIFERRIGRCAGGRPFLDGDELTRRIVPVECLHRRPVLAPPEQILDTVDHALPRVQK